MAIKELRIGGTLDEFPGGTINKLIRAVNQLLAQQLPRRGGGGGGRVRYVGITKSVTGATWVGEKNTNKQIDVYGLDGESLGTGKEQITVGLDVSVTVSSGKFKKAIVLGNHLLNVQCKEWDLPAGWVEAP
jgi:hypothetical protein